jgi:putative Holliday junction resolvase
LALLSKRDPAMAFIPRKRIAGIDYGTVRIGIAIGDEETRIGSPFETYNRRTLALDTSYFQKLAKQEAIALFVVGLPVHLSGDESQKSYEARQFAAWLHESTSVPIELFDERFTSSHAEQILLSAELTKKKRKARLDSLAAQILLTAYFESTSRGQTPKGLDDR